MKKDLPENVVADVAVAIVLSEDDASEKAWDVYLLNEKDIPLSNVMVSSKGYGNLDGREVQTSTLRHFIGDVAAGTAHKIEAIDPQVFSLTNEYWLSFYIDKTIYDKKYIFLPESVVDENMVKVPLLNKLGVLIGGNQ